MNQLSNEAARKIDNMMNTGTGAYMSRHVALLEAKEHDVPFTLTWEGAACEAYDNGRFPTDCCDEAQAKWSNI